MGPHTAALLPRARWFNEHVLHTCCLQSEHWASAHVQGSELCHSRGSLNTCLRRWLCVRQGSASWNALVSCVLPLGERLCSPESLQSLQSQPNALRCPPPSRLHRHWNKEKALHTPAPCRAVHKGGCQCHFATFPSSVWIIALSRITYHTFNT